MQSRVVLLNICYYLDIRLDDLVGSTADSWFRILVI